MNAPRTSPDFPGISLIDLNLRLGVFHASLTRHWSGACDGSVWYELVLRIPGTTYVLPCERRTAAQLLVADKALRV